MMTSSTNRLHFPAKIYLILENESPDIIRWHPNNKAFRIIDHQRFEREIIPKYFRHNQMSSVQRQLNLYGFRCVSRGEDKGSFYHPKFQRGDWEQAKLIRRCVSHNQFGLQHWKLPPDMKSFVDNTDVKDIDDFQDHELLRSSEEEETTEMKTTKSERFSTQSIVSSSLLSSSSSSLSSSQLSQPVITSSTTSNGNSGNNASGSGIIPRKSDWAWPPMHVLEQQRSVNTNIMKAFQPTTDLAQELVQSVSSTSRSSSSSSVAVNVTVNSTVSSSSFSSSEKGFTQPSMLTSRLGYKWNTQDSFHYRASSSVQEIKSSEPNFTFPEVHRDSAIYSIKGHPSDTFEELIEMCQDLDSFLEDCDNTTVW